jgi:hypothetical protein
MGILRSHRLRGLRDASVCLAITLSVAPYAIGAAVVAKPVPEVPEQEAVAAASTVSMDQAVKMAEQRFKARVVRAESQHEGVHTIYILKLLNDAGHVWTVRVDATNGAIL